MLTVPAPWEETEDAAARRSRRAPLPARVHDPDIDRGLSMTHEALVEALRSVEGLVDVSGDPPTFHVRSRPFLHFHDRNGHVYADVKFGSGDFEPVWASTSQERLELLGRVIDHVQRLRHSRKSDRRDHRNRRRR